VASGEMMWLHDLGRSDAGPMSSVTCCSHPRLNKKDRTVDDSQDLRNLSTEQLSR
jgi:hypothetical protein